MSIHSNGKDLRWLSCCWCPAQPKPAHISDDRERDVLLCLAQAKREGWQVKKVAGIWCGLCPECLGRGCKFQGPMFLMGISGNPSH